MRFVFATQIWLVLCSTDARSDRSILIKDVRSRRAVQFSDDRSCQVYGHPSAIQGVEAAGHLQETRIVGHHQLRHAIDQCQQQPIGAVKTIGKFDFIYPGTRWCGPGDVALHYHDLGFHSELDSCCRAHDFCFDVIPANACKHGICNTTPFTTSHCDCDEQFRACLMNISSPASHAVGLLFFDVGAVPCFRPEVHGNPERCRGQHESQQRGKRNCEINQGETTWQFFPAVSFKSSKIRERGRLLGRAVAGTSDSIYSISGVFSKLGDVSTIVKSVVSSTIRDHSNGRV